MNHRINPSLPAVLRQLTFEAHGEVIRIVNGKVFPPVAGVSRKEIEHRRVTEHRHVTRPLRAVRRHQLQENRKIKKEKRRNRAEQTDALTAGNILRAKPNA